MRNARSLVFPNEQRWRKTKVKFLTSKLVADCKVFGRVHMQTAFENRFVPPPLEGEAVSLS